MARSAAIFVFATLGLAVDAQAQTGQSQAPADPSARGAAPAPGARPPPEYYVEPPDASQAPARSARPGPRPAGPPPTGIYEPPPPGYYGPSVVYEPPPPPKPHHVAPKYSLWVGPRVVWFVPFGSLWYKCNATDGNCNYSSLDWNDRAGSGPMFELDAGARLGRNYNLFALWEHAALSEGQDHDYTDARGGLDHANTDYVGVGFRISSDPDDVGFVTEIELGARRFRAVYNDGSELRLREDVPLEARIGFGADIRLSPLFSLSPMLTLGVGRFDAATNVDPNGNKSDALARDDELASHGWLTLQLGAHFDLAGGG